MKNIQCDLPFVQVPLEWVKSLKGEEVKRLILLQYRFDFFASIAATEGRDITTCFYESQERLADLFGMSRNSRTKVGEFLRKMELLGYISTKRENIVSGGKIKTRVYIVVNNPQLMNRYSKLSLGVGDD